MKKYKINEIFYSLQGEGIRAGSPNIFVRFSNCNLACRKEGIMGFDCDTEFMSGAEISAKEIVQEATHLSKGKCKNVIFTGGEPALQLDDELIKAFEGWYRCIETNGTIKLPQGLHWICVSPKTAEHTLKVQKADEVKYVRHRGQFLPVPSISALNYLISPAFESDGSVSKETLEWCINLVKENPKWRLSIQQHKLWKIR